MSEVEAIAEVLAAHHPDVRAVFTPGGNPACTCGEVLGPGLTIDRHAAEQVARITAADRDTALREARDDGIRQAIEWLRAEYEYGTGPEWREDGAEWIADRAADERRPLVDQGHTGGAKGTRSGPGAIQFGRPHR